MSSILYLPSLIAASSRDEPTGNQPQQPNFRSIAQHHAQLSDVHANLSGEMRLCSNLPAIDQGAAILQQLAEISNNVNTRFTAIENRFTALETRFTALENTLTTLENRSDTHLTAN